MKSAEILHTRKFARQFRQQILLNPTFIRIAVPFLGNVPGYGTLADFVRIALRSGGTSMDLITRQPGQNDGTITTQMADVIVALGVNLLIRKTPLLHSKVYQVGFADGRRASFVGSSNLSTGGLKTNDETMALLLSVEENQKVKLELDRLTDFGAMPYTQWKALKALGRA